MKLLAGKSTLVTGAMRGIGREIALEFARQGAHVAFTDRQMAPEMETLAAEITAMGVKALPIEADAASMEANQKAIDTVVEQFGALDVIVNNAGITIDTLLLRMSEEQFDKVMKVNLYSVFYNTKAALKPLLKQRSGSIINIASIVGVTGNAGQANYAASKGGMIAFTKSTAKEVASRGIRVNAIAPGFIATDMTAKIPQEELNAWLKNIPLQRAGTPLDIAQLCVFLGSDMSTYITGQVLHVDGGMHM
jgi:3-oxoacyl-[acyl-carrier protein] reductase